MPQSSALETERFDAAPAGRAAHLLCASASVPLRQCPCLSPLNLDVWRGKWAGNRPFAQGDNQPTLASSEQGRQGDRLANTRGSERDFQLRSTVFDNALIQAFSHTDNRASPVEAGGSVRQRSGGGVDDFISSPSAGSCHRPCVLTCSLLCWNLGSNIDFNLRPADTLRRVSYSYVRMESSDAAAGCAHARRARARARGLA